MNNDNRPTTPPIVGGIFKTRIGGVTDPLDVEDLEKYNAAGKRTTSHWDPHPWDLIELIAIAVPVQELAQLRRAEAAMEESRYGLAPMDPHPAYEAWLAHHTKEPS